MDRRVTEFVKVWKSPEDLPRVIGRGLCDLSSRRIRWGLCVLRFKYLAAPTRRTTVTEVGTGLPNHCLHRANWFYFLNPFISSLLCCVLDRYCLKTWIEDFLNFLSSISSVSLSSACISCVYAFCTLCLSSFHHDDYACVLLCLLLSTYSAASSSSIRNFLTSKFLSVEFIKIAYSPPPLVDITHFQLVSEQGTPLFCVILV